MLGAELEGLVATDGSQTARRALPVDRVRSDSTGVGISAHHAI